MGLASHSLRPAATVGAKKRNGQLAPKPAVRTAQFFLWLT
jgi:hypothetical protein